MKTIQFRPLLSNEFNLLSKMEASGELGAWRLTSPPRVRVAYRYQEHRDGVDYTVALVRLEEGSLLVGASKRNPADPRNRIRGEIEALKRAFASSVAFELPASESEENQPFSRADDAGPGGSTDPDYYRHVAEGTA